MALRLGVVDEFVALLRRSETDYILSEGRRTRKSVASGIAALQIPIARLAEEVGFTPALAEVQSAKLGEWPSRGILDWAIALQGFLGGGGARSATGHAGIDLELGRGDPTEAVRFAANLIEEELQRLTNTRLDGLKLIDAFAASPVKLVCGDNERTNGSYHDGIVHLLKGIHRAFRNPLSHGTNLHLTQEDAVAQAMICAYLLRVLMAA